MWPFRVKKEREEAPRFGPPCTHCQGIHTAVKPYHASGQASRVKVWRGQRYLTCRCLDCGREFYSEEPPGLGSAALVDEDAIDEEELQATEEELKREVEEERKRRIW